MVFQLVPICFQVINTQKIIYSFPGLGWEGIVWRREQLFCLRVGKLSPEEVGEADKEPLRDGRSHWNSLRSSQGHCLLSSSGWACSAWILVNVRSLESFCYLSPRLGPLTEAAVVPSRRVIFGFFLDVCSWLSSCMWVMSMFGRRKACSLASLTFLHEVWGRVFKGCPCLISPGVLWSFKRKWKESLFFKWA